MMTRLSRRAWLKHVGAAGAGTVVARRLDLRAEDPGVPTVLQAPPANGTIQALTSTSEVFTPSRGRAFFKFSFDFPEPSVAFEGLRFGFRIYTHENVYGLDHDGLTADSSGDGLRVRGDGLVWAGGQERAPGRLDARLRGTADGGIAWDATVEMEQPIKAVSTILRGVPRGEVSGGGSPFGDRGDNELLFGYPFSGGDLFGNVINAGLTTPLVMIRTGENGVFYLSSRDDRVRTKRFYLQPGEAGYRVELNHETEGWTRPTRVTLPPWRVGRAPSAEAAAREHYDHVAQVYRVPRWATRADAPAWMRRVALAVTLHGQHYTGYIFNDYARMLEILRWIATRIPADRVLAFIAAWDGRYYWDYPLYRASDRMGGEAGFRTLIQEGQRLGFAMMPMFGANAANRQQPVFSGMADAATDLIDGNRFDLDWVDWDNDRHQEGWLAYMNLGVESWRRWLDDRIADCIERYRPNAYFLDIVGGWVNNPKADMHEGTKRLILDLRQRYPDVAAVGEMHYDALLEFIPLYHAFSQTEITDVVRRYARFFQHLSAPAPGRGSSGVHEAGFGRWREEALGLNPHQIPTLQVVDDTFDRNRAEMDAVIQAARERADIR